jgi:hypothetical protein
MSRIRRRSANSLLVNQEKPNAVGLGRRQRCDHERRAAPGALQILTRQEERLAIPEHRVGDGHLLRPVAPHPNQDDGVLVVQEQQYRMAERRVSQTLPIEPHAFGAQPEFPGQLDEARHRQAVSLNQVAAADGANLGIDPVLRAEAKETGERGLAGNDIPDSALVSGCDAHVIQPPCTRERDGKNRRAISPNHNERLDRGNKRTSRRVRPGGKGRFSELPDRLYPPIPTPYVG